jgi:hypothetical protein
VWSSADGRTIGWLALRDWPLERRFTVVDGHGARNVPLPTTAVDPTLHPDGHRIVYRDGPTGTWRLRAIDSAEDTPLVGADWSHVRAASNGAIAAVPELVHRGQLCLTSGATDPSR